MSVDYAFTYYGTQRIIFGTLSNVCFKTQTDLYRSFALVSNLRQ
jgi:hypothetical protein